MTTVITHNKGDVCCTFRCGICGLMYSWMDNLQKHMRVHVDKPIGCFRCHKSFRDEESFNQHTLVHKREDVEKRAQGLPVTPSTPETEDVGNIITIGMPGNLTSRIPARTNVINITPVQQKDIPIATNVMSLAKSAVVQHNTDKSIQVRNVYYLCSTMQRLYFGTGRLE